MPATPWPKRQPPSYTVTKLRSPPAHLEEEEATLFREIVAGFRVDDPGSVQLLITAMEAHQRARHCRMRIDQDGEAVTDRFGQIRQHPLLASERDARGQFLASMRALNLEKVLDRRAVW
jgi:hypothetical protein